MSVSEWGNGYNAMNLDRSVRIVIAKRAFGFLVAGFSIIASFSVASRAGPANGWPENVCFFIALLSFPVQMLISAARSEFWFRAISLAVLVTITIFSIVQKFSDAGSMQWFLLTLAFSFVCFGFSKPTGDFSDSWMARALTSINLGYVSIGLGIVVAAFIYASVNRYTFIENKERQKIDVFDKWTGAKVVR